ncbi:nitrate assimilation regulatory protein nirA [Ophiocordyceps camponoti-floridani]|uniref:Nitrate assimilation regulatory protein nirA n=1 Tax=Ophiocordyceps camponoti-floridani TaxID=2030778 RepID=A0A8H4Q757_9HYPO|nr:nitrate assimilation regulatory protein nirA [Ophiocordyceps camponoti-floridani]
MPIHLKCLDCYDSFLALPMADATSSPFVLFVHIFYHFCVLRIFWPLANSDGEDEHHRKARERHGKAEDAELTTIMASAVDHARLLLTKMSETHHAAAIAADNLQPRSSS